MQQKKVIAQIEIDGQAISYDQLQLMQRYDWHHYFKITTDTASTKGLLLQKAKDLIGKFIKIELEETDYDLNLSLSKKTNVFHGVVSGISHIRDGVQGDALLIIGEGMSKLLDEGDHTRSFTDQSLKQIVNAIFQDYSESALKNCLSPAINPKFQENIPYIVQYKESNFEFLNRLASQFGEWFFYNGQQFVFGKPSGGEDIPLQLNINLDKFDLSVKIQPIGFKLSGYDYRKHEFPEAPSEYKGNLSKYAQVAYDRSKDETYKGTLTPLFPINRNIEENKLKTEAARRTASAVNEMVHLGAESFESNLIVGALVNIQDDSNNSDEKFGQFVITRINHHISETGENYYNTFEAVPAEVESLPDNKHVEFPYSEGQMAEVTDINDTEGIGRVQVQFNWQKGTAEKSPWIRVISSQIGKDKGDYVNPEIGDFVFVEFEQNNPDYPYVQGGFYHAKAKPEFFDSDNNMKVFKTRSGNMIFLNDEGGKETVKISNPDGKNEIVLALGDKPSITIKTDSDLNITAGSSINMSAPTITINGSESIAIVSKEINSTAENAYNVGSAEMNLSSDKASKINSSGPVDINSQAITSINAKTIKLNS